MTTIHTVEAAYHPKDKMGFLIDWLLTLKCNYDCAYCSIGPHGHDNSTKHPPLENCITMLQQLYQYTDAMLEHKKPAFKDAILNVYGGEALYHPHIENILIETTRKYEKYSNRWRLRRRLTTNATATENLWHVICEHIEGITFSYHSQGSEKMKTLFKKNIEHAVKIKKEHDIIVCMYPHLSYWQDCLDFLQYCDSNGLNARPKLLDGPLGVYAERQLEQLIPYIKNFDQSDINKINKGSSVDAQSRGCCGGRSMCINRNIKEHTTMIPREVGFKGWHCSANQFFIHGNNVYGTYYTNKDCQVRLDQTLGPIATVDTMEKYIEDIKKLNNTALPTLRCVQQKCWCGTCAPKSIHKENLDDIMKIYNNSISQII